VIAPAFDNFNPPLGEAFKKAAEFWAWLSRIMLSITGAILPQSSVENLRNWEGCSSLQGAQGNSLNP
jgi:hypothetical protein